MSLESTSPRYADTDFVRVMAILLLHVFHTGMMFNAWAWHVKNAQLLPVLTIPWQFMHAFRMPLLMLVAGAGTAWALRRRSLASFVKERSLRLLLPLVVGIFVIVPPQIYIERIVQGVCHPTYLERIPGAAFHGSYWEFWPSVLQMRSFPAGNTSWHHLWFVAYLFTYCLLALPLFAWLKRPSGERALAPFQAWFSQGIRIYLLFLPLALVQLFLRHFPQNSDLIHDPRILTYFGLLFLYGHLLARCPAIMDRLVTLRGLSLGLALLLYAGLAPEGDFPFPFEHLAVYAFVWLFVLAILGYARKYVTVRRPWLAYSQEIAYPFYILHQTVIILVGYWLLNLPLGPWTKMALVFAVSFTATALLCELIRRTPLLRPLFGLKPLARKDRATGLELAAGHTA
jgi:glucans biosynthesis protein C